MLIITFFQYSGPFARVKNLWYSRKLKDISFQLKRGEILGIGGLVGAGKTEILQSVFGLLKKSAGEFFLYGNKVEINNPRDAIHCGIDYLPEDRKEQGLILSMSVCSNMVLPSMDILYSHLGLGAKREEERLTNNQVSTLNIKTQNIRQLVKNLSGGNQQKVVLGKWLAKSPQLLLLDEPTRGVDVGAKSEIYTLMRLYVENGNSIIMVYIIDLNVYNMDRLYYEGASKGVYRTAGWKSLPGKA